MVVGEDEAIAARQRDAQNTQDGFVAGIPLNVGRNNLHELRPIHCVVSGPLIKHISCYNRHVSWWYQSAK